MSATTTPRFKLDKSGKWQVGESVPWPTKREIECLTPMGEQTIDDAWSGLRAESIDSFVNALSTSLRASILAQVDAQLRNDAQQQAFDAYGKIVKITTDMFGDRVRIKSDYDPSFPDERYILFIAEVDAGSREILGMESEWNRQVSRVTPYWHGTRLSIKRKK